MAETQMVKTPEPSSDITEGLGYVKVRVEICLPDNQGGRIINVQKVFHRKDRLYLKDYVELALDQTSTYIRRDWETEVEPLLSAPEKVTKNDDADSGRL